MTVTQTYPSDTTVLFAVADLLREEMREHAVWCGTCGRRHIRGDTPGPFVDINPDAIPADRPEAHDRVTDLIGQMPAQRLGHGRVRIAVPSAGHAVTVASHLRALGTPAHAIYVGGTL